jgi:hypothetical protein
MRLARIQGHLQVCSRRTEYWDAVESFQKFIVAEGRKGFSPERLGAAVHLALNTAKPKARYAVIKQRFKNWTLPRFFPRECSTP